MPVKLAIESNNSKSQVRLSVVVPIYNTEIYLEACVNSILDQGYPKLELVLVDDGSTDASGAICDAFATKYSEIVKVIHKSNEGLLLTRRAGFAVATGDYILSVDSDDMLSPCALETIASLVNQTHADVIRFGYSREHLDLSNELPNGEGAELYSAEEKTAVLRMLCTAVDGSHNPMCFKAIRRECLDVEADFSNFKGLSFAEDLLQTLHVYDRAEAFCFTDAKLYFYRPSLTSMTKEYSPSFFKDVNRCLDEAERYAAMWEHRYSCDGLVRGVEGCRLDSLAQYVENVAHAREYEILDGLRTLPAMRDVACKGEPYSMLRVDRRLVLAALEKRWYLGIRALSKIRGVRHAMKMSWRQA